MGKVASSTAFVSGVAFTTGHSNINEDSGCFSRCSVVGRGRSSIRGALDGRLATPRIGRIGVHKKSPRYHKNPQISPFSVLTVITLYLFSSHSF